MTQLMDEHTSEHEVEPLDDYAQGFTAEYSGIYTDDGFPGGVIHEPEEDEAPRVAHIVADLDEPDDRVARSMALPAAPRGESPAPWLWATPAPEDRATAVARWVSPSAAPGWDISLLQRFWLLRPTVFAKLSAPRAA
jgi:hypothetical protein